MSNTEYTPNSNKYKAEQQAAAAQERKKLNKVIKGGVKQKSDKKGLVGTIVSGDAKTTKNFLISDVLIPAAKNLLEDIVIKGTRLLIRGETGSRRDGDRSNAQFISYNTKFTDGRSPRRPVESRSARMSSRYDELILTDRADAEEVLYRMREQLTSYGLVSIADLYDFLGESCEYTDHKYGWTNLDSAGVVPVRGGYTFDFPRAIALK